jgi:hypothetical protein
MKFKIVDSFNNFKVGETYYHGSMGDDRFNKYLVVNRTNCFISIKNTTYECRNEPIKKYKIKKMNNNDECIRLGSYSLAPSLYAKDKYHWTMEYEDKNEPKSKKYLLSVKTDDKYAGFDFTFSRSFHYKTIKTKKGFLFIFNNFDDYMSAVDLTTFSRHNDIYKWNYMRKYNEKIETYNFKYPERCRKIFYKGEYQWREYMGGGHTCSPQLK